MPPKPATESVSRYQSSLQSGMSSSRDAYRSLKAQIAEAHSDQDSQVVKQKKAQLTQRLRQYQEFKD